MLSAPIECLSINLASLTNNVYFSEYAPLDIFIKSIPQSFNPFELIINEIVIPQPHCVVP